MTLKLQDLMVHVSTDVVYLSIMGGLGLPVSRLKYFLTRVPSDGSIRMCIQQTSKQSRRCCPIASDRLQQRIAPVYISDTMSSSFVELRQGDITMLPGLIRVYVYMCSYKCLDDTSLAALGRRAWSFTYASKRLCSPLDSGERARIYSHAVGRWVAPRVTALPDRPDRIDTPMLSLFSPPRMPHPDSSSSHLHRKDPVTLHVDNVARPCRHLDM